MTLSVKSQKGTVLIKWTGEMAKGEMTAEWRISPTMSQEEVLDVLVRATNFLASQMGSISQELDSVIAASTAPAFAKDTGTTTPTTSPGTASGDPIAPSEPQNSNVARVPMMPPASLSDAPAGGAPTNQSFWSGMPTTVPGEMTASPMGWEMIPPGED